MRPKRVSDDQIENACGALLAVSRVVTFRDVCVELRRRHGASGRAARVNQILGRMRISVQVISLPASASRTEPRSDDATAMAWLEERVRIAEQRALCAEERDRRNQDFFANRYAQQRAQLAHERAMLYEPRAGGVSAEQYSRIYQRASYFRNRLATYEVVEPLLAEAEEVPGL